MKKTHVLWGVLLIVIGVLWMLVSADMVSIVRAFSTLWPVFVVAAGITFLLKKEAHTMRALVWVLAIALVIGYGIFLGTGRDSDSGSLSGDAGSHVFELEDGMKHARMEVNTGAATLRIGASDAVLAQVNSDIKGLKYDFFGGRDSRIEFSHKWKPMELDSGKNFFADLSKAIVWDLEFNSGATDGIIDFSGFPLESCEINAGTCDLRIIAGSLQDETNIECNGGTVKLSITLPEGAGIRIKCDAVVNDISGKNITLNRNGSKYESSNYHSADSVINLDVSSGAANITVNVADR